MVSVCVLSEVSQPLLQAPAGSPSGGGWWLVGSIEHSLALPGLGMNIQNTQTVTASRPVIICMQDSANGGTGPRQLDWQHDGGEKTRAHSRASTLVRPEEYQNILIVEFLTNWPRSVRSIFVLITPASQPASSLQSVFNANVQQLLPQSGKLILLWQNIADNYL